MKQSVKASIAFVLALGAGQVEAIELGQLQVHSALGQPLVADIPLTLTQPGEDRNLSAQLGSIEDFALANIPNRPTVSLQFSVVGSGSQRTIHITSSAPINDPYLELLIRVSSAAGSRTFDSTLLLDPAGMQVAANPQPVAAPLARAPRPKAPEASRINGPSRRQSAEPSARQATPGAAAPSSNGANYGPIQRGQNLSLVARATAQQVGVDANQMLIALKRSNPDAFYRDNINALKTGVVLRIPSHEEAAALSATAAAAAVRQENASWRGGSTLPAPTTVAQAAAHVADSAAGASPSNADADRLALVSTASGSGNSSRQQRQRAAESISVLQQQDTELKSRLKELEDLNGKSQRLLALKDSEIAELQKKLAEARKAAGAAAMPGPSQVLAAKEQPATVASVTPVPASPPAASASSKPAHAGSAELATAASTAPAHAAVATTTAPVASTPVVSKPANKALPHAAPATGDEQTPWYAQPWLWLAALVVLLLAFLGLRGRRKPEVAAPKSSLADSFSHTPFPPEQDADQHALLDQLAEHPDDLGLHLELVSLYYSRRDVERFEAAAEAMHAHISDPDQPEWEDVVHMGQDLAPEHPLFAEPTLSSEHATVHDEEQAHERDALEPFDLDRYASATISPEAPGMAPAELPVESSNVDFTAPVFNHTHEPKATDSDAPIDWHEHTTPTVHDVAPASADHFNDDALSEDAVDTKLDLARAYIDMGDPEGARAMLGEVLKEGSQMQRDVAQKLLDELH